MNIFKRLKIKLFRKDFTIKVLLQHNDKMLNELHILRDELQKIRNGIPYNSYCNCEIEFLDSLIYGYNDKLYKENDKI